MNNTLYNYISILVAFIVSYLIRVLPLTLIRKPIKSKFIQSFLYYVPYVTLSVMTFPAILQATQTPLSGACYRFDSFLCGSRSLSRRLFLLCHSFYCRTIFSLKKELSVRFTNFPDSHFLPLKVLIF